MYKKHSLEERLLAVKKCLEGLSPRCVGRQLGINSSYISEWLYKYQREGSKGLEKRPNIRANFAEKCKIVCAYAEKGIPLHRVSSDYHVSQSSICLWTRIYRQGGYGALRTMTKPDLSIKSMGRPKKQEPQTELERVRYENEWLRAEVALLKKVRALMDEKERQLREIGRKPSSIAHP